MTKTNDTVLILGGTGKVGRRLAARLRVQGHKVRAVGRSTPIPFDWNDPETWEPALSGVGAAYLIPPDHPVPAAEFAKLAADGGVRRLVAQAGRRIHLIADRLPDPDAVGMHAVQKAVQESGVEWTVLQPNNFNQNFDEGDYREAILGGELILPIGETVEPFVDVQDIADVAAVALTQEGHAGRVYELTGPRALTFGEAAGVIGAAAGRDVAFKDVGAEEFAAGLRAEGAPEPLVGFLDLMFAVMREGKIADVGDHVNEVLGRAPIDFADYAVKAAAAGAWN